MFPDFEVDLANEKSPPGYKSAYRKAKWVAENTQRAAQLVDAARKKAEKKKSRIAKMKEDLENLFRMIASWARGEYRKVPIQTMIMAIAAIIYFLNPFDFVHDYLPGAGYLDDATLLAFVVNSISEDIKEFLIWEKHSRKL